jgi:hypothetical protein
MPCPPPFEPTFPFGPYLRFTCRSIDLTIRFDQGKFLAGQGEEPLARWGFDFEKDPEHLAGHFYGYSGYSHRDGTQNIYRSPHIFRMSFQKLTQAEHNDLQAIWLLWQEQQEICRLYNGRILTQETKPRRRAKFNPAITYSIPVHPEIEFYFGIFDVQFEVFKNFGRYQSGYRVDIEAREWNPATPVQGDIA